jgi:hypothetical protein
MELVKDQITEREIVDVIEDTTKCNAYFVRITYLNLHNMIKSHGKKLSPWLKEAIEETCLKLRAFDQKVRAKLPPSISMVLTETLKTDVVCSASNIIEAIGRTTVEQHETVERIEVIMTALVRQRIGTTDLNTQLDNIINSIKSE